jgi:hypothetical protein
MIEKAPIALLTNGGAFDIRTDRSDIDQVMLVRRKATTHLVDGDQRSVVLPIVDRMNDRVTVKMTENRAVLPAGKYMLFVSYEADDGMRVPSESIPVSVLADPGNPSGPLAQQVEPAPEDADEGGLVGGLLDSGDNGGSLLDPVLDLSSGGISAVPTIGQLEDGTPQLLTEAGVAVEGGASVFQQTVDGVPVALQGLVVDFASLAGNQ